MSMRYSQFPSGWPIRSVNLLRILPDVWAHVQCPPVSIMMCDLSSCPPVLRILPDVWARMGNSLFSAEVDRCNTFQGQGPLDLMRDACFNLVRCEEDDGTLIFSHGQPISYFHFPRVQPIRYFHFPSGWPIRSVILLRILPDPELMSCTCSYAQSRAVPPPSHCAAPSPIPWPTPQS